MTRKHLSIRKLNHTFQKLQENFNLFHFYYIKKLSKFGAYPFLLNQTAKPQ